jgi:hypothetical protein
MANEDAILEAVLSLRDATEQSLLRIENRLDRVEVRLDGVEIRLHAVETRLQTFEIKVYRRFDDLEGRLIAVEGR